MTEDGTLSITTWIDGRRYYRMHGEGIVLEKFREWMEGRPVVNRRTAHPYTSWSFARNEDDALFKLFWWDYTTTETMRDSMGRFLEEAIQEEIDAEVLGTMKEARVRALGVSKAII